MTLTAEIEEFFATPPAALNHTRALQAFNEFKFFLNRGEIRAAERVGEAWEVHPWVKKGILLGMRLGAPAETVVNAQVRFIERTTFPLRHLSVDDGVMLPAGGSAIRDGAFVGRGVLCEPPTYIDAGAYVDADTAIGSHSLIGSCVQVGKNVRLGPGTLLEGTLEPLKALPVILEDDVSIMGGSLVGGSVIIRHGVVIGPGVMLTAGTEVHDVSLEKTYAASGEDPLIIPPNAVVVSGQRPLRQPDRSTTVTRTVAIIVRYREPGQPASAVLKDLLV